MLALTDIDLKQTRFFQEVLAEGRQEGRKQGEAAMLLRLFTLKFGPPAAEVRRQIVTADADTLLRWSERVLTAATLGDVLDPADRHPGPVPPDPPRA